MYFMQKYTLKGIKLKSTWQFRIELFKRALFF